MRTPEDFLMLVDLEVCVDKLAREIAFEFDPARTHDLLNEILTLVDAYGPDRLRKDAPSLLLEAGLLSLEVAIFGMKAAAAV